MLEWFPACFPITFKFNVVTVSCQGSASAHGRSHAEAHLSLNTRIGASIISDHRTSTLGITHESVRDCKVMLRCVQAELLEQSNMNSELASKLEMVTTDVNGLGRYLHVHLALAAVHVP